jgi:hypothetical protein
MFSVHPPVLTPVNNTQLLLPTVYCKLYCKLFVYVCLFGLQIDILYVTPSMVVSTATKAREPARIGVLPNSARGEAWGGGGTICIVMEAVKVMSARETREG